MKEETGSCHVSQMWSPHHRGGGGGAERTKADAGKQQHGLKSHVHSEKVLFSVPARPSPRPGASLQDASNTFLTPVGVCLSLSFFL